MNEDQQQAKALALKTEEAKKHALIAYGLLIAGYFTGICWIIGFVWALVKKPDAAGTKFVDHYDNIISLFWWSLGLSIISLILTIVFIGFILLFLIWVWTLYKIIKGLANLTADKPYNA